MEFDLQKVANKVFETIAMAKVSTSGEEARENNFLSYADGISVNSDHLLYDAKQAVFALHERGYKAPIRKKVRLSGKQAMQLFYLVQKPCVYQDYISEHDLKIAKKLAYVIAGGKVPFGTEVDEQYLT